MVYTVFIYFDQLKKLDRKCLVKVEAIWIKLGISPPNALKLKQCLLATEGQISFITYSHIRQKIKLIRFGKNENETKKYFEVK